MLPLIFEFEQAKANILQLSTELKIYPDLQRRLSYAHAYYIVEDRHGLRHFGFSKYCGFRGVDATTYLSGYRMMNGRDSERALGTWFQQVPPDSLDYKALWDELSEILARYEKIPRRNVRLSIPRPYWQLPSAKQQMRVPTRQILSQRDRAPGYLA